MSEPARQLKAVREANRDMHDVAAQALEWVKVSEDRVAAAESAIVVAAGMAVILTVPPLVAVYCRAYPGGDRPRIRLPGPNPRRRAEANA